MTTIAASLITILIDIARAIGRWVVKRVVNLGIKRGIPWMQRKINTFKHRRNRALGRNWNLRAAWLAGRIRRWQWALAKVEKHRDKLADKSVKAYCKATGTLLASVPWYANPERCPASVLAESPTGLRGAA